MAVIGISCFYHDSAAALVSEEGNILAAAQEERFSRLKHDSRFPFNAIEYCLQEAKLRNLKISSYVYYEKPIRVFMRLLENYFNTAPRGLSSYLPAMKIWIKEKLYMRKNIINNLKIIDSSFDKESLYFSDHHMSHAASAFYPSMFKQSAVLCLDAVGEWSSSSGWIANENKLDRLWEINYPDSLGLLYSSFTYYCGFKVNSGEYKLMGLAPYGDPIYKDKILDKMIDLKSDGSYKLNMKYFKYHRGLKMISNDFIRLFQRPPRSSDEKIDKFYMDIASSIQKVLEEVILKIAKDLKKKTNQTNLCLSGGVALNCVANNVLLKESGFKNIWVQPASGDAGSSIGAALAFIYLHENKPRKISKTDSMSSSYLGPKFHNPSIEKFLLENSIPYRKIEYPLLIDEVSTLLSRGKIIGWFQGRMEFGPRSLGNRSIIADPRIVDMQKKLNLKIKFRESFRPFAPSILEQFKLRYFNLEKESPYMLFTRDLEEEFLISKEVNNNLSNKMDLLNIKRSDVTSVTHVDNTCRVQTVSKARNKLFYDLINSFYKKTKCPILINTSFNVRGEPIVCNPEDAFTCFINTDIDFLVLGNYLIKKNDMKSTIFKKFKKIEFLPD